MDTPTIENITAAVHQAIGAASMCWERVEGAGVFDSNRALEVGKELLDAILPYFAVPIPNQDALAYRGRKYVPYAAYVALNRRHTTLLANSPPVAGQ